MSHPPRRSPPAPKPANEAQQHDLSDGHATRVVAEARIGADDLVLEVGPGLGALTAGLLTAGARVVAIERDPRRITTLRQRFAKQVTDGRLTLVTGDALDLMPPMPDPWRVLANPPFALTAPLVRRWLLECDPAPTAIELVLQREAALKLTGSDGGQTRSSIIAHLCGIPQVVRHLPRDAVTPPSRVDLAVWRHRRDTEAPRTAELLAVDRLLDTAFAGPRTMQEALRGLATGVQIRRQAAEQGWKPQEHPRTLPPAAWLALTRLLITCGRLQIGRQRRR